MLDEACLPFGPPVRRRKGVGGLLRSGAAATEETPLPPFFDTRLWYRSAHEPYLIEDQGDCAACVFISAATVAMVRSGIQRLGSPSAAVAWRRAVAEGAKAGGATLHAAVRAFEREMAQRARARPSPPVGLLDWKTFVCCAETSCSPRVERYPPCYHHLDGDPKEAAFSCEAHAEGVVPHHFVQWVADSGVGFRRRAQRTWGDPGPVVVRTLRPERKSSSPRFALVEPIQVPRIDEQVAAQVAAQVRRIKTSIMANGPVMAMMRIDGKAFDIWGTLVQEKGEQNQPDVGAAERLAYRLPGPDAFDEYHEVVIVGWTVDDAGTPCWIAMNSYGAMSNDSCVPGEAAVGPELRQAYHEAGITSQRGCVFVEMVNADLVTRRMNTDLENNVIAFLPSLVDRGFVTLMPRAAGREDQAAEADEDEVPLRDEHHPGTAGYVLLGLLSVVLLLVLLGARGAEGGAGAAGAAAPPAPPPSPLV